MLSVVLVAEWSSSSVTLSLALSTSGLSVSLSTFLIQMSLKLSRYLARERRRRPTSVSNKSGHVAERYVIGLVFSPLVDGLHDGGHEDLVLRHGLDADRHSVQPLPSRITRHAMY